MDRTKNISKENLASKTNKNIKPATKQKKSETKQKKSETKQKKSETKQKKSETKQKKSGTEQKKSGTEQKKSGTEQKKSETEQNEPVTKHNNPENKKKNEIKQTERTKPETKRKKCKSKVKQNNQCKEIVNKNENKNEEEIEDENNDENNNDPKTIKFIAKGNIVHDNKYDYSKVKYLKSDIKVTIICKKCNLEFSQLPASHHRGIGCPNCGSNKMTLEEFIEKAKTIHGDLYDYSEVKLIKAKQKVTIICNYHGTNFLQSPSAHLSGQGCSKCSHEKLANLRRLSTEDFIKKSNEKHDFLYDYSQAVYVNGGTKIEIICNIHGPFMQEAMAHMIRGIGCLKCAKDNMSLTTDEFIERAKKVHGDAFDYTNTKYEKMNISINIKCNNHDTIFNQSPRSHLLGHVGCSECKKLNVHIKQAYTTTEFIEKAREIYGDKFDYSKSNYVNNRTKIIIICKKHATQYTQMPIYHYIGNGCPSCNACQMCGLWRTFGKLCAYCSKPIEENKLYKKTKEMIIVNYLKKELPDTDFIHNKSVGTDCTGGHLFPDIRIDCNFFYLIVEVDEHEHRGASYACDIQRMYDIIAKLALSCVFIRYNPDNKKSDKTVLLDTVKKYLALSMDDPEWNDFGLITKYLFYKNKN